VKYNTHNHSSSERSERFVRFEPNVRSERVRYFSERETNVQALKRSAYLYYRLPDTNERCLPKDVSAGLIAEPNGLNAPLLLHLLLFLPSSPFPATHLTESAGMEYDTV